MSKKAGLDTIDRHDMLSTIFMNLSDVTAFQRKLEMFELSPSHKLLLTGTGSWSVE